MLRSATFVVLLGLIGSPGIGGEPALADEPAPVPQPVPQPAPPAEPAPAPAPLMFGRAFREGRPSDALVKGDVPLLRGMLDAYVDLIEAVLDIGLTAEEEQAFRDGLETAWSKLSADDLTWFNRQALARDKIREAYATGGDKDAGAALLAAFKSGLDERLSRGSKGAWERAIQQAVERKGTPFSAGTPPVSVGAMNALEEVMTFLVGVGRNDEAAPTEGQRIAVRPRVKKAFDTLPAESRARAAKAHKLWLLVKAKWDQADEASRLRFRWAVVRLFRSLAKLPAPDASAGIDLPTYAKAAAEVASSLDPFDAYTNVFANLDLALATIAEGLGVDPKALDSLFTADPLTLR